MLRAMLLLPICFLFSATILLFILVSAANATSTKDDNEIFRIKPGNSSIGNYLAGRHAQARHDMRAAVTFLEAALKAMPHAPNLLQRTFFLLVIEGRIKEALPLAKKLSKENPKAPIAILTLAIDALRRGNFADVIARFKGGTDRGLISFTRPIIKAWALAGEGKSEDAQKTLTKLDGNESTQGLYDVHRALLLDFMGDPGAEAAYQALADKGLTGSIQIVLHMGQYHERRNQPEKARALYDKIRTDLPGTTLFEIADRRLRAGKRPAKLLRSVSDGAAEALFSIANSLRQQRAQETALALARLALYLRPNFPIALVLVADILEDNSRYADANSIYKRIGANSYFRASADLGRAKNMDAMGKTDTAIALYQKIAAQRQHDPQPLIQLGNLFRRHKRWKQAIVVYTDAIARVGILEKRFWRLLYARGIAYERAKRWSDAEKDLLQALEFQPEQPFILNYVGYSWIDQGLHLERAQNMIRRAAELRPRDGFIIDSLGWGYYRLGKYEQAVKELERSIQIRPQDPVINDHLGDAYWRVGRKLEAEYQWKRSLSLNPDKELAAKVREKLKHGLGAPKKWKQNPLYKKEPVGAENPSVPKKI